MQKKLIISIDGGGIRGIIPLVILRSIQFRLKKNLNEICSAWYGTSTGSVIAAGTLIQQEELFADSIQNVLDIYEFRSKSSINPLSAANPARALNKILDENFMPFTFSDFPNLNVVASKVPTHEATVFNLKNNVNVAAALKASCAVPGIFDAIKIGPHYFVDGFLAAKNPAAIALQNEMLNENVILLSLGTGILRVNDEVESHVKKTHEDLSALSEKTGFHYYRINPRLELASDDMQNTNLKNIFNLKKDTENHLKEKREKLNDLINLLGKI